jgi:rhodanese-related sulfurtransferase
VTQTTIDPATTMADILEAYPSAQRALFQRYHVGGCSSCGFQPTDTLAQVCKDHNILDVKDVVSTIVRSHEVDQKVQIEPGDVKKWLDAHEEFSLVDVRSPEEWELARIDGAELLDYTNSQKYMELPKDRKFVFMCKSGIRSLDVASYFIGHGFRNVWSMRGGIDLWRAEVDPSIPEY